MKIKKDGSIDVYWGENEPKFTFISRIARALEKLIPSQSEIKDQEFTIKLTKLR